MTKKRKPHPTLEEVLARPWCYYCERDFDDLKVLLSHQKAKHFKCERCGRRLNTAGVHKENLDGVENAIGNRGSLAVEIFGMEGIPDDVMQAHNQRVITKYNQDVADRQAAAGNQPAADGSALKKPRTETTSDLKARLAAFKAKKALGETAPSSGSATPQTDYDAHAVTIVSKSNDALIQPLEQSLQYGQHIALPPAPYANANSPFAQSYTVSAYTPPPFQAASNGLKATALPLTPNLPSRPSFAAPTVNAQQLQQMHSGQYIGSAEIPRVTEVEADNVIANGKPPAEADAPEAVERGPSADKTSRKERTVKLMWEDNDTSPEEMMARLPRYAFNPNAQPSEIVLGDASGASGAAVTGPVAI